MRAHERERLAAWIDGELPLEERTAVETHLAECEECAALLADMEAVDRLARELPLEAPARYFEAFPARVRARIEANGPLRGASRWAWRTPAWTWAAAAALLLGVVTPLTIARLGRDGAPEPDRPIAAEARDTLAAEEAWRPQAPRSIATGERPREAGLERPRDPAPAEAAPPPAAARANAPAPGDLKKELRQDADDAERVSSAGRRSGVEGFAAAPEPERHARRAPGQSDAPAAPATRDIVQSPALLEAAAGPGEGSLEAGVVALDEAAPEAEAPRAQAAGVASTALPLAVPSAKSRDRREADTGGAPEDARDFDRLSRDDPVGAAAWRERRGAWVRFVEGHPQSPFIDEARVQVIEAGIEAWRADGDPGDLSRVREDAEAYLARDDARQKERVRGALESIGER